MTDEEFREIWIGASSRVADRFYPKGQSPDRGNFLRDQGVLFVELVNALTEAGMLEN